MLRLTWFRKKPASRVPDIVTPVQQRAYKIVYPYVLFRGNCVLMKLICHYESGPMTSTELSVGQVRRFVDHMFDIEDNNYPIDLPYLPNKMPESVMLDLQDTLRRFLQDKPEI